MQNNKKFFKISEILNMEIKQVLTVAFAEQYNKKFEPYQTIEKTIAYIIYTNRKQLNNRVNITNINSSTVERQSISKRVSL